MEVHSTIAQWDGDSLTLYESTQGITSVRNTVARHFGMTPDKVRVVAYFTGGGFGSKGGPWSHESARGHGGARGGSAGEARPHAASDVRARRRPAAHRAARHVRRDARWDAHGDSASQQIDDVDDRGLGRAGDESDAPAVRLSERRDAI